jgi:PncC family amidohydrolase
MHYTETISSLVHQIKERCLKNNLTISTAESCTGGLIGGAITSEPGISACYPGGIVSYANEVKNEILGVSNETLSSVGAVSPECAKQMAEGVRLLLKTDSAVAVTGIAGPDGGTPQKPVGLVYIATATPNRTTVEKNIFSGNRDEVRQATVKKALEMLLDTLPE